MKEIDLTMYGKPHPADPDVRYFIDAKQAKDTVDAVGFKDAILRGPVNVVIPGRIGERYEYRTHHETNIKEGWMKAFFGPTARDVGIDLMFKNLSINGVKLERNTYYYGFLGEVLRYLLSEEKRLIRAAKETNRKTGNTTWSNPGQLLIPDIGTVIRLTEDWTFRLYDEYRNKILKHIGKGEGGYNWNDKLKEYEVMIPAGCQLSVDRVYIRKGAGEFSSITFNLHKGSTVVYNGKTFKAQGRFWAKLSDVNKMKVEIDMKTLAEN